MTKSDQSIERFHMTSRRPSWCPKTKKMVAMMVYQTNLPGMVLYLYANTFICFSNPIWLLVTRVKTLHSEEDPRVRLRSTDTRPTYYCIGVRRR